jgi:ankyrin repeat protein
LRCALGHESCVRTLVQLHADIRIRDNDDDTPLDNATLRGHHGCAKALLEAGAKHGGSNKKMMRRLPTAGKKVAGLAVAVARTFELPEPGNIPFPLLGK